MHSTSYRSEAEIPAQTGHDRLERALLDCTEVGLIGFDAGERIAVINAAAQQILGLQPRAALDASSAIAPTELARLVRLIRGELTAPVRIVTNDGLALTVSRRRTEVGAVLLSLTPVGFDAVASPRTDALTGLADRHLFNERLETLCAASEAGVALLMVDLDRFKLVNDTLGHQAGDALLRLVAQRLRSTFRTADVIARLGGDEFAVAISASAPVFERPAFESPAFGTDVAAIAERLVAVLSRPYLVERQSAVIGASVGLAFAPMHGTDPASLVRAADLALYQAKADGRGIVRLFNTELDQRTRIRHALADDLRRAIPLQQLQLYFQPQLCLQTRALTGFEALVRWPHKDRGLIPPDQFIPLAEDMGLIIPLGEWVLREACRQAMTWPDHISVAVNVSPKQLLDRERLPRQIAAALASTGLAPQRLEIEITESALVREAEALHILTAVRAMGVSVSLDDFGTGYSSLSQLRRFPFDKLKIDRSFVRDIGDSTEAAAVVRAIAALGKSLGMTTIAEGVETPQQEAVCRADGCSVMQGYLVSRPVPGDQVACLIHQIHLESEGYTHD